MIMDHPKIRRGERERERERVIIVNRGGDIRGERKVK